MSSFRKPLVIYRREPSQLIDGYWSDTGFPTTILISASVQPDKGLEMQSLPDGRRVAGGYNCYTDAIILTSRIDVSAGLQYNPDIIVRNGLQYEAVDTGDFQSDVINHYKVIFIKTEAPISLEP